MPSIPPAARRKPLERDLQVASMTMLEGWRDK